MDPISAIRQIAALPPEVEVQLIKHFRQRTYAKGQTITGESNLRQFAFYIVKGAARVYHTLRGHELTNGFAFDDEFLIVSHGLLHRYPDTMTIEFLEPTTVTYFPPQKIQEMVLSGVINIKQLARLSFLAGALIQYHQYLEERVDVLQTLSASERYHWVLERYPRITTCATSTQIASFLGITKETLYRIKNGKYGTSRRSHTNSAEPENQ